jgi:hypothetical protein
LIKDFNQFPKTHPQNHQKLRKIYFKNNPRNTNEGNKEKKYINEKGILTKATLMTLLGLSSDINVELSSITNLLHAFFKYGSNLIVTIITKQNEQNFNRFLLRKRFSFDTSSTLRQWIFEEHH